MKNKFWHSVFQVFMTLAAGAMIIVFVAWANSKIKQPEEIKEIILRPPECSGSFEEYWELSEEGQSITLVKNAKSYARFGRFVIAYPEIEIKRTGIIACGYLYIRASKDGLLLDEKYDSIYINPHDRGGHLARRRSLELPVLNTATQVLFSLDFIPHQRTAPYDPETEDNLIADWVRLLNSGEVTKFYVALSVENSSALIEEITIAYKCWNPDTGKETQDCVLQAISD